MSSNVPRNGENFLRFGDLDLLLIGDLPLVLDLEGYSASSSSVGSGEESLGGSRKLEVLGEFLLFLVGGIEVALVGLSLGVKPAK